MFEQIFKTRIAAVSDPSRCSQLLDALAAAGIQCVCRRKDVNQRSPFDQAKLGASGIKPKYVTELFVDKKNAGRAMHILRSSNP